MFAMKSKLFTAINNNTSIEAVCKELFGYSNGNNIIKLHKLFNEYNIDKDELKRDFSNKRAKYESVIKVCPVCGNEFTTKIGSKSEKMTCSHSCSNTYFNGAVRNINVSDYRVICFRHHKKECIICGENKVVDVHHHDGNRSNNIPENLIPICPTHHRYWHSKYRTEIKDKVEKYLEEFKNNRKSL